MKPTKVRIFGIDWAVVEDKRSAEHGRFYGKTVHGPAQILLEPEMSEGRRRQTVCHEIIHVISNELLDNTAELKEAQVRALGAGWYQVLRDNPGLVAWLMESEPEGEPK